jgi:CHASE2 domain-containing sensor protein
MFRAIATCFVVVLSCLAHRSDAHDFVTVFFDDESAKALHTDAPLPRALKAQAIKMLYEAGARGLVLKYFEDLPSDAEQDRTYAKALCLLPTTLQACLCLDGSTNALPGQFYITKTNRIRLQSVMSEKQGYIPLPQFCACARGVGFVDLERPDGIPLIERYQGRLVKSLYVTALELETGERADYSSGTNVVFGNRSLSYNELGEHQITGELRKLEYLPFHHVLQGTVAREKLRGKVVILGYDGTRIHSIHTPWGEIKAHRLLVQSLIALTEDLKPVKK